MGRTGARNAGAAGSGGDGQGGGSRQGGGPEQGARAGAVQDEAARQAARGDADVVASGLHSQGAYGGCDPSQGCKEHRAEVASARVRRSRPMTQGSRRGKPNFAMTLLSKRVIARIRSPASVASSIPLA